MNTNIKDYIVSIGNVEWNPLTEEGVDTKGIFIKVLRFDEAQKRPPSFILKFESAAKYPYHNHPGGEELFIIEGSCIIEDVTLNKGDYLYTPPNFKHSVRADTGCEIMFIVPEEVQIL